jgi:metal-responsive CopG/Arc/MetJ family transcriptional regulator
MPKITLSIPKELKNKLDKYPELSWSEILRRGIKDKIEKLKKFEEKEGEL